jgi:hypothetical protein
MRFAASESHDREKATLVGAPASFVEYREPLLRAAG